MLKINQNRPKRSPSYAEREDSGHLMCTECWSNGQASRLVIIGQEMSCPSHGPQPHGISEAQKEKTIKYVGEYEADKSQQRRKQMQDNGSLVVRTPDEAERKRLRERVYASMVTSGADLGTESLMLQAAGALTDMAMFHGLSPFNGELFAIPKKKEQEVVAIMPFIGIKGVRRKAREQSQFHIFEENIEVVSGLLKPDRVKELGVNICRECFGGSGKCSECSGSGWWKGRDYLGCRACGGSGKGEHAKKGSGEKKCAACSSTGMIDPGGFLVVRIPIIRLDYYKEMQQMAREAKALGWEPIPPHPTIGQGIWRAGENVPSTWTPEMVARKRAERDGLLHIFDLPLVFGAQEEYQEPAHGSVISGQVIEDRGDDLPDEPQMPDEEPIVVLGEDTPLVLNEDGFNKWKMAVESAVGVNAMNLLTEVYKGYFNATNLTNIAAENALAYVTAGRTEEALTKARDMTREDKIWKTG